MRPPRWAILRISGSGSKSAGTGSGYGAQKESIVRQMTDCAAHVGGRSLGRWVALLPTKMGGGTYALDLHSNPGDGLDLVLELRRLQPDRSPLCAFPSADPYRSFEFVNSTQGGENCLIYGIPTSITEPEPGFNFYRVRYDGARMELIENVSERPASASASMSPSIRQDAQCYSSPTGRKTSPPASTARHRACGGAEIRLGRELARNSPAQPGRNGGVLKIWKICSDAVTRQIRLSRRQGSED